MRPIFTLFSSTRTSTARAMANLTIALINTHSADKGWDVEFNKQAPDINVRIWPNLGPLQDITHAIVCQPPPNTLSTMPNLKCVHSLWAGVEHVTKVWNNVQDDVPLLRLVDPALTQGMVDYVTGHVYRYHLELPRFDDLRQRREWKQKCPPLLQDRTVGIMGMGALGSACGKQLRNLGFKVRGWSRSGKIEGLDIKMFAGNDQLREFLQECNILVLLLPDTPATNDVINKETLQMLPKGAALINAGRGNAVHERDLIDALNNEHLSGATLDVFKHEPLPANHEFWAHPKVYITPHVAAETRPDSSTRTILENIAQIESGVPAQELAGYYSFELGY